MSSIRALSTAPLAFALAACFGVASLPEGEGEGLVGADRAAPADGNVGERPAWSVGDWFRYRHGGVNHMSWRVTRADDAGYTLTQEATGAQTLLDPDFGIIGEDVPDEPESTRRRAPVDNGWTWPLWVGKRWSTHYLRKAPGAALPVRADYVCDARESVTVPAGTFDCFRVWRTARPLVEGRFLEAVQVAWWAPDVGYFVKRLDESVLLELEAFHRQR